MYSLNQEVAERGNNALGDMLAAFGISFIDILSAFGQARDRPSQVGNNKMEIRIPFHHPTHRPNDGGRTMNETCFGRILDATGFPGSPPFG